MILSLGREGGFDKSYLEKKWIRLINSLGLKPKETLNSRKNFNFPQGSPIVRDHEVEGRKEKEQQRKQKRDQARQVEWTHDTWFGW